MMVGTEITEIEYLTNCSAVKKDDATFGFLQYFRPNIALISMMTPYADSCCPKSQVSQMIIIKSQVSQMIIIKS
jgi:hypothetical protein